MRHVVCSKCGGEAGHGVSRVFRKIVFHFCAYCWRRNQPGCESTMQDVAQ